MRQTAAKHIRIEHSVVAHDDAALRDVGERFPHLGEGTRRRGRTGGAAMRYLALDFETGNASPLSACALGASVFEDNQLVDEKISLIRPPECVGRFHWGNVRVNHIKEKMVARNFLKNLEKQVPSHRPNDSRQVS